MIAAKLMGGMGNQMFQYAFARSMSLKTNKKLKIDLTFLNRRDLGENFIYRNYDLDIFNIRCDFITDKKDKSGFLPIAEYCYEYSQRIVDDVTKSINHNIILEGYWQTPKYFKNHEDIIRSDMEFVDNIEKMEDPKILSMLNDIRNSNSVMVNIRRTDYLNTDYHGVIGNEYVDEATKIIESKITSPKYFVFSDDIEWCRSNINLENMVIVDHEYSGKKFEVYLQLMKNCKNFIIPNSSFAWWAAWLNENEGKIVIAPKKWFSDQNRNTSDLIPENWIRI